MLVAGNVVLRGSVLEPEARICPLLERIVALNGVRVENEMRFGTQMMLSQLYRYATSNMRAFWARGLGRPEESGPWAGR